MATFFQRLIDLGEELTEDSRPPSGDGASGPLGLQLRGLSSDTLEELPKAELVDHAKHLGGQLVEWRRRYDELQAESQSLRSEYDAYRKKMEVLRRQQQQQRADDKALIEELRRAGSSGSTDAAFAKQQEEQIRELKLRLRDSVEEMQKAYKRQREAEEARASAEAAKKEELEALWAKFDAFKERTKRQQKALDQRPPPSPHVDAGTHLHASAVNRETEEGEVATGAAPGSEGAADGPGPSEHIATLKSQLAAALQRQKESQLALEKCEERLLRQQEDAKWDEMEAEKKVGELRTQIDELKAKVSQLEAKLEAREDDAVLKERDLRKAIRDLEDAVSRETEHSAALQREADNQRIHHENALQIERERLAKHSELVGEAESVSRNASEALERQRAHYERQLNQREAALQESIGAQRSLEAALQEARDDVQHHMDAAEDLRRELDREMERSAELELQLTSSQRLIALREEDVVSREQERQKLRAMLRGEEENSHRVQKMNSELETRLVDLEMVLRQKTSEVTELERKLQKHSNELRALQTAASDLERRLKLKEQHVEELHEQLRAKDRDDVNEARARRDSDAQIRVYVHRINELEAERTSLLAQRLAAGAGAHPTPTAVSTGADGLPFTSTAASRQQFIDEAVMTARRLRMPITVKYRRLIAFAAIVILSLVFLTGLLTSMGSARSQTLENEFFSMKERLQLCELQLGLKK